jgi:hypothetical protein
VADLVFIRMLAFVFGGLLSVLTLPGVLLRNCGLPG